jgi:hypothetical protein
MIPGVSTPSRTGTTIRCILDAEIGKAPYAPGIALGEGPGGGLPICANFSYKDPRG